MLKAAYRFFDNEAIDPQEMLASPVVATSDRLANVPRVLAVQDTTEVDWTVPPATTGLGPLAHPDHQGLLVHTTLALTPERVPLGLLAQQVWARAPDAVGKRATRKQRPIAEKESQKWLTSVEAVSEAHARCPHTHLVCIGDREADVYDLFLQERPSGVDLLVRASWNRRVDHPERYLWTSWPPSRSWPRSPSRYPAAVPSRRGRRRSTCGGVWCSCARPRTAQPRNCRRWRCGRSKPGRSSRRRAVSRSSGCC